MIEKKIKYIDYNGVTREEPYYFNISKRELMEMQYSKEGGYDKMLEKIMTYQDNGKILNVLKELILTAYGEKSDDGRSFIKEDADGHKLANKFKQSAAFDELCYELMQSVPNTVDFVKGILDPSIVAEMEKQNPELMKQAQIQVDEFKKAYQSGNAQAVTTR